MNIHFFIEQEIRIKNLPIMEACGKKYRRYVHDSVRLHVVYDYRVETCPSDLISASETDGFVRER